MIRKHIHVNEKEHCIIISKFKERWISYQGYNNEPVVSK